MRHLIYDGKSVYELDEECLKKQEEKERQKEMEWQRRKRKNISYGEERFPPR